MPQSLALVEVDAMYGGAAGVARRLRAEGLQARVVRGEVIVQAGD